MRVTVFNGSPRGKRSNTHRIVTPILEGAREAGAQTEEIFLIEEDIKYCRGCFVCWGKTPGRCSIDDAMSSLIDRFLQSDYVGLGTPVYGMYMTGLLKNFTDRLLPLATPHIRKGDDGTFYHDGRVQRLPKQFFVANAGFPGEHNFDLLQAAIAQQAFVFQVYRNCGEILNEPEGELKTKVDAFYDALREAGREMVANGHVPEGIVERIHAPLISDEDYMAGANEHWDEEIAEAESD